MWGGTTFDTGGRYNPSTDTWIATSTTNAPSARGDQTAVWTGSEMIAWGADGLGTGGRYHPDTDTWTVIGTTNAPTNQETAVWTGSEMITWGGFIPYYPHEPGTGGRYNPATDSWTAISTLNAPFSRYAHTATWTGTKMIVWGGDNVMGSFRSGGRYCAQAPTPPPTGGNGSFIIGDLDAVVGHAVYFWGSQWAAHNHLSQGAAPSAFKGFANSIGGTTPNCADVWQSDLGNNSGPPLSVPDFITVIASSSVTKSGPVTTGNNRKIVVGRTDPGYNANPSHPGTGTVVSVTCQ